MGSPFRSMMQLIFAVAHVGVIVVSPDIAASLLKGCMDKNAPQS